MLEGSNMEEKNNEVINYVFKNFTNSLGNNGVIENYQFQKIDELKSPMLKQNEDSMKVERLSSKKDSFIISPIVKEHRGLLEREENERERRIEEEVARRVESLKEEAFKKGFNEGVDSGREDIFNQTKVESEEKLSLLTEMIHEVLILKEKIMTNQKEEIYKLIRNLTKWVILKELKDDGKYLVRLLEKLIVEAQTTSNLLIQVNQNQFSEMPEVLKSVEEVLGKLENVRVEVDYDISENGIVVDSDNGIIRGTLDEQFKSLDELFEKVGIND